MYIYTDCMDRWRYIRQQFTTAKSYCENNRTFSYIPDSMWNVHTTLAVVFCSVPCLTLLDGGAYSIIRHWSSRLNECPPLVSRNRRFDVSVMTSHHWLPVPDYPVTLRHILVKGNLNYTVLKIKYTDEQTCLKFEAVLENNGRKCFMHSSSTFDLKIYSSIVKFLIIFINCNWVVTRWQ